MSTDRVSSYADAVLAVANAEQNASVVDEFFAVADAVAGNDQLSASLDDSSVPAGRRQQIVEDVLDGKASAATSGLVSMVVAAGRAGDLGDIAREAAAKAAQAQGAQLAEVRSAVPLDAEQISRLEASLRQATGSDVTVKVTVDPSVVGGIVTQIGDTVIDGSVRRKLTQMRDAIAS